jgi:hypothetical protein
MIISSENIVQEKEFAIRSGKKDGKIQCRWFLEIENGNNVSIRIVSEMDHTIPEWHPPPVLRRFCVSR